MNFLAAVQAALRIGMGRKDGATEAARAYTFTWLDAVIAAIVLVGVQIALFVWSFSGVDGLPSAVVRDTGLVIILSLALPYAIYWITARAAKVMAALPGAYVFLALVLAALQIVSAVLANLGQSTTAAVGLLAVFAGIGARSFFGLGRGGAIAVGVAIAVATIGAGLLLLVLPGGKMLLG